MQSLQFHLDRLIESVRNDKNHLPWSNILIVEDSNITREKMNGGYISIVSRTVLYTPEEYSARFDELLERGFAWINTNAAGVLDDTLFVVIELPTDTYEQAKGKTSVNLSGACWFNGKYDWNASRWLRITD